MIRFCKFAIAAALVVTVCSCGTAKTYDLQLKPELNKAYAYDVTVVAISQNKRLTLNMGILRTATRINGDHITFRNEITKEEVNKVIPKGVTPESLKAATVEQIMDVHGQLVSQSGGVPGMRTQDPSNESLLPPHPVKVGDTWKTDYQGTPATSVLQSIDEKNGKQLAHVAVTLDPGGQLKSAQPFHLLFDIETGMLIEGTLNGVESKDGTADMTIRLIEPAIGKQ